MHLSVRRLLKAPCDHKPRTSLCGRFQLPGVALPSSELPTSSKMSRTTTTDTLGKTTCYAKTALTHPCATGPRVILPRVIKAALCSHCDVRRSQGAHGGWARGPWAWPESSSAGRGCCRRWWPCSHVHPAKPAKGCACVCGQTGSCQPPEPGSNHLVSTRSRRSRH